MAGDAFKKVQPGQRMEMTAEVYNAFIDAARAFREQQHDMGGGASALVRQHAIFVRVRNQTGQNLERFTVVALRTPIILPENNVAEFKSQVAFNAELPTPPLENETIAILTEPLATDAIGRAVVAGATPAKVNVLDLSHRFAEPVAGEPGFKSAPCGRARILWREAATGERWAVVLLSGCGCCSGSVVTDCCGFPMPRKLILRFTGAIAIIEA